MLKKLRLPLRLIAGALLVFMGGVILAALVNHPELETQVGPRWELAVIAVGFLLGGAYTAWLPTMPARGRSIVAICFWLLLGFFINWSAFAPSAHVLTKDNPAAESFGLLAVVWDILITWFLYKTAKGFF
jgi:hypothetical protein